MVKRSSWHSIKSGVYHNNFNCNTGNNIEKEHLKKGTGNKLLCLQCARLNKQGGSTGKITFKAKKKR